MTAGALAPAARRTALLRAVAPDAWDGLLWASGAVALGGIVLSSFVPAVSELAVYFSLTLLINGPYSMALPVAYEPIVMVFGRLYPPLLIAVLGTLGQIIVEHVNYRLFAAALQSRWFAGVRASATVRRIMSWFRVQPFFTVVVSALTPVPFWAARACAALDGYPLPRFLAATAAGRFPRLWFYAAVAAALPIGTGAMVVLGIGVSVSLAVLLRLRRRRVGDGTVGARAAS